MFFKNDYRFLGPIVKIIKFKWKNVYLLSITVHLQKVDILQLHSVGILEKTLKGIQAEYDSITERLF